MRAIIVVLSFCFLLPAMGCRYHRVDDGEYRVTPRVAEAGKRVLDDPGDASAWIALGDAYRAGRQFDQAYGAYTQAEQLAPDDKTVQSRLAAMQEYRPLTEAERAVLANPMDDEAWGDLADLHRAAGREEEAIACYRRAATLDPADGEWQNALLDAGVPIDELMDVWMTATDDERLGDLADALVEQGRIEEALQMYQRAHELDPDDDEWTRKIAQYGGGLVGTLGTVGGIADTLAGVAGGTDDEAIGDLGDTYATQGNRELALQHYRRALELDPTDAEWQNKLAIYGGTAALSDFMEGRLAADPRNDELMGQLAKLYAEMGHTQRALELYLDALAIDPADGDWHSKVALLGGLEMASKVLSEKLIADPNNDEIIGRLGDVQAFTGDRDGAVESYKKALALDPADSEWRTSLAALAGTDVVLEVLEPVLSRVEDDETLGDLGDIYAASGNTARALELYRRAAAIDPEDSEWSGKIAAFSSAP